MYLVFLCFLNTGVTGDSEAVLATSSRHHCPLGLTQRKKDGCLEHLLCACQQAR